MSRIPIRLPGPKSKYRAVRTGKYASKKEAKRGAELELLEKLGKIRNLYKQQKFQLIKGEGGKRDNGVWYVSDFSYWDCERNEQIVEDVKGFKTQVYRIKKRLMWSVWKIRITEI